MTQWGLTRMLAVAGLLCTLPCGAGQSATRSNERPVQVRTVQGSRVPVDSIAGFIGPLMAECGVTDLSMVVINDAKVTHAATYRRRGAPGGVDLEPMTVFRASSLSKPVFAYLVMRLVDRHQLDLDTPLFRYLPQPVFTYPRFGDLRYDRRHEAITARLVLSHQTGFPDWRWQNPGERLDIKFFPGRKFGYSGEGYEFLQFVVETKLGKGLAQLAREEVFVPLGMTQTSFCLEERFTGRIAGGVSQVPEFLQRTIRTEASAAGSMVTTAADYGRFVAAVLTGEGLSAKSAEEMVRPQVRIASRRMSGPRASEVGERTIDLAWCLGWGKFETAFGGAIFHPGQDKGCENYAVVFLRENIGMIVLSAGDGREPISPRLVARVIGDGYSPFDWMGY